MTGVKPQQSPGGSLEWEGTRVTVVGLTDLPKREESLCQTQAVFLPLHPIPQDTSLSTQTGYSMSVCSKVDSRVGDKNRVRVRKPRIKEQKHLFLRLILCLCQSHRKGWVGKGPGVVWSSASDRLQKVQEPNIWEESWTPNGPQDTIGDSPPWKRNNDGRKPIKQSSDSHPLLGWNLFKDCWVSDSIMDLVLGATWRSGFFKSFHMILMCSQGWKLLWWSIYNRNLKHL